MTLTSTHIIANQGIVTFPPVYKIIIDNVGDNLYLKNGSFKFDVDPHHFNEVVNHVRIYGSKKAVGCSAFQRRSCVNTANPFKSSFDQLRYNYNIWILKSIILQGVLQLIIWCTVRHLLVQLLWSLHTLWNIYYPNSWSRSWPSEHASKTPNMTKNMKGDHKSSPLVNVLCACCIISIYVTTILSDSLYVLGHHCCTSLVLLNTMPQSVFHMAFCKQRTKYFWRCTRRHQAIICTNAPLFYFNT